jgi:glycosyltransferase involved in cell wall biosynthesis
VTLVVELDREAVGELPAGRATAVTLLGSCTSSAGAIRGLDVLADDTVHPVSAFGMPRPDLASGPLRGGGFWATIPVRAHDVAGQSIDLALRATLADGGSETAPLGAIVATASPARAQSEARPGDDRLPLIAVCMATYEPDRELFRRQLASLRAQNDQGWICLISDDGSRPEQLRQIEREIDGDPRFELSHSESRVGFYRNFERALSMVPASAALVAMCDQDDRWDADKLGTLRGALGAGVLVYSDLRVVEADGTILRDTLWVGRSNNHTSLTSMLVANTITGAATLFRRDLLELALPFPDTPGVQFHDVWIAVIALAAGAIAYVERPLYDYVQHPGAVFGDVTHGRRRHGAARELAAAARSGQWRSRWRAAYFYGYMSRQAQATAALARCDSRLSSSKRRELERFIGCDGSPRAVAALAMRPGRMFAGRTETLGSELGLASGIAWKLMATAAAGRRRPPACLADASVPAPWLYSQRLLRRWRSRLAAGGERASDERAAP